MANTREALFSLFHFRFLVAPVGQPVFPEVAVCLDVGRQGGRQNANNTEPLISMKVLDSDHST